MCSHIARGYAAALCAKTIAIGTGQRSMFESSVRAEVRSAGLVQRRNRKQPGIDAGPLAVLCPKHALLKNLLMPPVILEPPGSFVKQPQVTQVWVLLHPEHVVLDRQVRQIASRL